MGGIFSRMPSEEDGRDDDLFETTGPSFDDEIMQKFEGIITRARSYSPEKASFISKRSASMPVEDLR